MKDKSDNAEWPTFDKTDTPRLMNQQATLTFNLEDREAERTLKTMLNVNKYIFSLYEIDRFLSNSLKYNEGKKVKFESKYEGEVKEIIPDDDTMEYALSMFNEILEENYISLEELNEY